MLSLDPQAVRRFLFVYLGAQLLQRFDYLILVFSVILAPPASLETRSMARPNHANLHL